MNTRTRAGACCRARRHCPRFDGTAEAIEAALARLEAIARGKGLAIGVASALPASVEIIGRFARAIETRGFALVPLSAVMPRRQQDLADHQLWSRAAMDSLNYRPCVGIMLFNRVRARLRWAPPQQKNTRAPAAGPRMANAAGRDRQRRGPLSSGPA